MKALILRQGKRQAKVVTGLADDDAALAMATYLGGNVLNEQDLDPGLGGLARRTTVVADVVSYDDELKARGFTAKDHAEKVKSRVADRKRRDAERAAEVEAKRRAREERRRQEEIDRKAQELRDQALRDELESYRRKAEQELENA